MSLRPAPVADRSPAALAGIDKVLVTGETGFIGRHLVARLTALGKTVVPASRRSGVDILKDDLPLAGVGHVFHAAGLTGVSGSWRHPGAYLRVNVEGTSRILEQCRQHGCGVTHLSAYVYGRPERLPISEGDRADPSNPYALSKLLAEQVCGFYAKAYAMPIVTLRLFNIYGPGQGEDFLIPLIIRQLLDPACTCIEVADLAPRRDYVHVEDAIEAILEAPRASPGSLFNVCSGEAHSAEEIIKMASASARIGKPYRANGQSRTNEIEVTLGNGSAMREALGWQPRIPFERGLRDLVEAMLP